MLIIKILHVWLFLIIVLQSILNLQATYEILDGNDVWKFCVIPPPLVPHHSGFWHIFCLLKCLCKWLSHIKQFILNHSQLLYSEFDPLYYTYFFIFSFACCPFWYFNTPKVHHYMSSVLQGIFTFRKKFDF